MKPSVPQKWKYELTDTSPVDQNLSQHRIVICTIFSYYYSMAIEASIPSAWCQQCWFWLLKSYAFTTIFTTLVFLFVTSFTLSPLLSFYLTIWFPLGWFLLWVKGNMRSSSWCFIFPSLHVFYILSFFKLFFLYFYDMSEIFVHFLLSCI